MRFGILFLSLIFGPVAQAQVDLSKVDLKPLVQIHSSLDTREGPDRFQVHEDENLFASQGGATISTLVQRIDQSVKSFLVRGLATSSQLGAFKSALAESRAGVQQDCEVITGPGGTTGFIEILWYGKAIRRSLPNRIRAGASLTTGVPSGCSQPVH